MQPAAAVYAFCIACLVALVATPLWRRIAVSLGWRDRPEQRKVHLAARPTAGGIAVAVAIATATGLTAKTMPGAEGMWHSLLLPLLPAALLVIGIGLVDDVRSSRPSEKLAVQIVALLLLQWTTGVLDGALAQGAWMAATLGLVFLMITNAMNLIDGLDGLASGLSILTASVLAVIAALQGDAALSLLLVATVGANAGFLRTNRHPARIFLGDSGSMMLGMLFGFAALRLLGGRWEASTAVALTLALWVPLLDTTFAVVRRLRTRVALFRPDRDHVHHRMLRRGLDASAVTRRLWLLHGIAAAGAVAVASGVPMLAVVGVVLVATLPIMPILRPVRVHTTSTPASEEPNAGGATPSLTGHRAA